MAHSDNTDVEKNCGACGNKIVEYFDKKYNGRRGMCPICNNNFPLE